MTKKFNCAFRAVFKWLSKVITWLRLLRLVIGLKDSRQFFNQWETKPKPIAPYTRDISHASGALQVIARNCDWFMELFVPVVIGRSNCFGFGFSTVIWKPLYLLDLSTGIVKVTVSLISIFCNSCKQKFSSPAMFKMCSVALETMSTGKLLVCSAVKRY